MSPSETRTIFYGPLVNPKSLSSFQALPRCLLAVAASGQIDWIEEDVHESALLDVLAQHGSLDVPLVNLRHGEFILPGFVDTHTVRILPSKAVRLSAVCSPFMAGPP
jgi:guanine deaminase